MAELAVAATATAATIVSGVMSIKPIAWDQIKGPINVSRDMKNLHEDLSSAMEELWAKKETHEKSLASSKSTRGPSIFYNKWIQEVSKLEKDVEDMNIKYERKSKSKFLQSFTCLKLRAKMRKLSKVAVRLKGKEMINISVRKEPDCVWEIKEAPDIRNFPTLCKPLAKILSLLIKPRFKVTEIRGLMGTGKTTIMQNLNNHEKVAKMFDLVIWVNVSTEETKRNFSLGQMQQNIVQRLNLDAEDANDEEVANRIRGILRDKKCLLLLDGVEGDLKLNQIGIDLNYLNGSKMVFTTRTSRGCDFSVDQVVPVGRLSNDEAQDMFKRVLGHSLNVGPVMTSVVRCCDNLPFVIKMIASAFKKRETEESWVEGYKNLIFFPNGGDPAIQKVYNYLEFCWSSLSGVQKDCLLYCALYPEEFDIGADCLLDCWGAEDLYGTNGVREFGCYILEELKKASLLEKCEYGNGEYVRMHKLMRKVALDKLLADGERKHLIKIGESLQDPPNLEEWNEKHRISLCNNHITTLSQSPNCPLLSTLILQRNQKLMKIHNSFFEKTENLRVLDLCHTGIASVPSSLWKLKLLKVLYLNDCTGLLTLPPKIGELSSLEVLDVRRSGLENIPANKGFLGMFQNLLIEKSKPGQWTPLPNIEKLRNLKRLLVSFHIFGNENDRQYISDYCNVMFMVSTTLEELVIDVKSYKQRCSEMINTVRDKVVATMPKLTTLKFCFEDGVEDVMKVIAGTRQTYYPVADDLSNFVEKMDDYGSASFQLFIGCSISSLPQIPKRHRYQRYLKYCNGRSCNPTTLTNVLAVTDAFVLVNHDEVNNLAEFGTESLHAIQSCLIEDCTNITGIADGSTMFDGPMLPNVLRLYIKNLPMLGSIWKDSVHHWSLLALRTLHIENCYSLEALLLEPAAVNILPNLKKLILVNLPNLTKICTKESPKWLFLEKLKIQKCPKLTEFRFTKDNTEKLKKLVLNDIPNLNLICPYDSLEWPALEKLKISKCPDLKELPFTQDNAKELSLLEVEGKWWETLQWKDPMVKVYLEGSSLGDEEFGTRAGFDGNYGKRSFVGDLSVNANKKFRVEVKKI